MAFTERDGVKLWYDAVLPVEGVPGTSPVLLLHGFASDAELTWERTGWLRAVADRGHVVTDLRGHGRSDRPDTGYTPEDLARDVLAVLDAAEVRQADVVAYSMGGLVAWTLAALAPDRVRAMALGGLDGRPVDRTTMLEVQRALTAEDLTPCIDAVAGHHLTPPPPAPVLFASGDQDEIAPEARSFAESLDAPHISLGRRNHLNAVSSRTFKTAALDFFNTGAVGG
ncbi:alpha/beta hydrolase [Saccharopolyspora sp. TS4A08]|uniref:Alpha/beta hydrolase n=1 Tax=Saccharopolyspora ipomoeae TaxID=3042027 RepID=A0ABT6PR21_9PSEU|nr:alpha/beta hydrolase [Saccharopolyspora sp. TS4A08]MDI2030113.1 alpha/beta hydrolase [Saccharopolyspora sp. TS4A08]